MKTQITKDEAWDKYIELAMFSYNTSVHEGTKYSPFELIFGKIARVPSAHPPIEENIETYPEYLTNLFNTLRDSQIQARENLIKAKEKSKRNYDRRLNPQKFKEGSHVFLLKEPRKGKFAAQYCGPYQIIEILPQNNVKLLIGNNQHRTVHTDKIRIAHIDPG